MGVLQDEELCHKTNDTCLQRQLGSGSLKYQAVSKVKGKPCAAHLLEVLSVKNRIEDRMLRNLASPVANAAFAHITRVDSAARLHLVHRAVCHRFINCGLVGTDANKVCHLCVQTKKNNLATTVPGHRVTVSQC